MSAPKPNEELAYLVGDLFGRIAQKIMDLGVVLTVGRAEFYGTPDVPPDLAARTAKV